MLFENSVKLLKEISNENNDSNPVTKSYVYFFLLVRPFEKR